jgi:glucokinase
LAQSALLGDIGATNARFALASKDELGQVRSFEVAKYPRFMDAVATFREEFSSPITNAVIAVAGPVVEQHGGKFGHASAERAISGSGLENLYQAIAAIDGVIADNQSAVEITTHALARDCEIAHEALHTFCAFFGSFAGSLALTFGAKGGVYIAGGISPRILNFLAGSEFRRRFESKGRFRRYLETIPSYVIVHPAAAFLGLQSLLE